MAKQSPASYPRPRTRGHAGAVNLLGLVEDGIYIVVAVLLLAAGALALWSAVSSLYSDLTSSSATVRDPLHVVVDVLDKGLILFIIAELLHTVRVTIQSRTLAAEPFLIVAIIAGIRRILILTAQAAQQGQFNWNPQGIELVLLTGLVLAMTLAVILWRRFYVPLAAAEAEAD
jgi:uncharacterized membrane protein (DUF373 family)